MEIWAPGDACRGGEHTPAAFPQFANRAPFTSRSETERRSVPESGHIAARRIARIRASRMHPSSHAVQHKTMHRTRELRQMSHLMSHPMLRLGFNCSERRNTFNVCGIACVFLHSYIRA
jgi:hypothetical protein